MGNNRLFYFLSKLFSLASIALENRFLCLYACLKFISFIAVKWFGAPNKC